ncbi:hypothetical protein KAX35_05195 [candidate division WOR-3 bacterium]|nr:hypothetical protein [candidate division WOR-3 bacterium]
MTKRKSECRWFITYSALFALLFISVSRYVSDVAKASETEDLSTSNLYELMKEKAAFVGEQSGKISYEEMNFVWGKEEEENFDLLVDKLRQLSLESNSQDSKSIKKTVRLLFSGTRRGVYIKKEFKFKGEKRCLSANYEWAGGGLYVQEDGKSEWKRFEEIEEEIKRRPNVVIRLPTKEQLCWDGEKAKELREEMGGYVYLEIYRYRGQSYLPYLMDFDLTLSETFCRLFNKKNFKEGESFVNISEKGGDLYEITCYAQPSDTVLFKLLYMLSAKLQGILDRESHTILNNKNSLVKIEVYRFYSKTNIGVFEPRMIFQGEKSYDKGGSFVGAEGRLFIINSWEFVPISDEEFTIDAKPGTQVLDHITHTNYIIK